MPNSFRAPVTVLRPCSSVSALLALLVCAGGAEPEGVPQFERHVRPILKAHCFHCHGEGEELEGGIDLRLKRLMESQVTGEGEPLLAPGEPGRSHLLEVIRSGEMPKGGKRLQAADIALVESWIAGGAATARPEPATLPRGFVITEEEKDFWSFRPVARPAAPGESQIGGGVEGGRTTPIDAFIARALAGRGWEFAPEADRVTLIQRVFLDMVGLPPAPEEVDAFLADTGPDAYERMVDGVLASARYGERWGRHWLDVAGYADSNGFAETDSTRPHAWPYRDYVIRSFNEDKPWDRFITEQLAGDELAGATAENAGEAVEDPARRDLLVATGFLRMGPDGTGDDVPDQNLARNQVVAETVKIVASSFLGLTVGCAECHDHRYDPISQADYYRMRAVFEPGFDWKNWRAPGERLVSLYTEEDRATAAAVEEEARKIDAETEDLRRRLLDEVFEEELAKLPEEFREAARVARATPPGERTESQRALFKAHPSADVQGALDLYDPERNKQVTAKQGEAAAVRARKPPEPMIMVFTERAGRTPETRVFHRGDHADPREAVGPAELEVLGGRPFPEKSEGSATSGRRLAFARSLTDGTHPLVARVLVNRFWAHHFGRGLVDPPGDFGALGEAPSHPELLDWLAREFVEGGWRLKPLHRLILTSRVYRQDARNPELASADPENRYYGRWKLRRLEAEAVRDSMLAVSGSLHGRMFGRPVPVAQDGAGRVVSGNQQTDGRGDPTVVGDIGEDAFRRSVYVQVRRTLPLTVFDAFDAPVLSPNCESRTVSVAPSQPLLMLNDTFVADQALRFARRLEAETAAGEARIERAWRLVFGAPPTASETARALDYLHAQTELLQSRLPAEAGGETADPGPARLALASFCQALLGSSRFLYIE